MFLPRIRVCVSIAFAAIITSGCASYSPEYTDFSEPLTNPEIEQIQADADIEALVAFAHAHHPLIKAAIANIESANAALTSAGAFADPQFSVSQGLNNSDFRTLSVEQEIPLFNRRAMAIEQGKIALRSAKAELEVVKANVTVNVVSAFSEYLYVLENLELQQDLIQLLNQFAAVAEQSYSAGSVSLSDLLRAQNAVDSARSEKLNLEQLVVSQRARLNAALGRDAREPLRGDYSLLNSHRNFARLPADIETLYSLAEEHSPQLAVSRYEIQSQTVATDIANTAGLPRLMVGVEYMNEAMGSGTFAGMASVSLPIWRSNYRAQREAANSAYQSAQYRLQSTQLEIQAELSIALYQWREAERNRELYGQVLLTRAEQAVATSLSNYQNGNASYTDVISSQQEWLSFALAYRRALANQLSAVAAIKSLITSGANSEVSNEKY